jgi:hypothetical protein
MKTLAYQVIFILAIVAVTFYGCKPRETATAAASEAKVALAYIDRITVDAGDNSIDLTLTGIKAACHGDLDYLAEVREDRQISISAFLKDIEGYAECSPMAENFSLPYVISNLEPGQYTLVVRSSGEDLKRSITIKKSDTPKAG